jgi:hypothetical protein
MEETIKAQLPQKVKIKVANWFWWGQCYNYISVRLNQSSKSVP